VGRAKPASAWDGESSIAPRRRHKLQRNRRCSIRGFLRQPCAPTIRDTICGPRYRNVEGQRFPVPLPTTGTPINWANFLPIGTSPAFYYKNVLPYTEEYQLSSSATEHGHLIDGELCGAHKDIICCHLCKPTRVSCSLPECHDDSQVVGGANGNHCGPGGENGVYFPITEHD